jgi:hypothetical protein
MGEPVGYEITDRSACLGDLFAAAGNADVSDKMVHLTDHGVFDVLLVTVKLDVCLNGEPYDIQDTGIAIQQRAEA